MAGSCSLERTARDAEISRLLPVGVSTHHSHESPPKVSLLCAAQDLVVLSSAWRPCFSCLLCRWFSSSPVTPLQPGHSFSRAAAATSPKEWHHTARAWDAPASLLLSSDWVTATLAELVVPAHMGIAISAVLNRDICPYTHCSTFEWILLVSKIQCVFNPEICLLLLNFNFSTLLFKEKFMTSVLCRST